MLPTLQRGTWDSEARSDLDLGPPVEESELKELLLCFGHACGDEAREQLTRLQVGFVRACRFFETWGRLPSRATQVLEGFEARDLAQPRKQRSARELAAELSIPQKLDEHVVNDGLRLGRARVSARVMQQRVGVRYIDLADRGLATGVERPEIDGGIVAGGERVHVFRVFMTGSGRK